MATLEVAQQQWQDVQKRLYIFCSLLMIELSTAVTNRQKLESQLQENTSVQNVRTVHAKTNRRNSRNCLPMRKYTNHTDRYYLSSH